MKTRFLKLSILLVFGLTFVNLSYSQKSNRSTTTTSLTVTYEYAERSLPLIVALEKGFFSKYGVNINPRKLKGESLNLQEVDIVNGYWLSFFEGEGINPTIMKFIHPFAMKKDGDMINGLLVKKSAGINSWKDFKAKTLVVPVEWLYYDVLKQVFELHGVDTRIGFEGISSLKVGGVAGFTNVKGGDALFSWAEEIKKLQEQNPNAYVLFARNLQSEYIVDPYFEGCTYINMVSFRKDSESFYKYINAIDEAIDFIREHPKDALAGIPKYFDSTLEEATRMGIYHFYKSQELPPWEAFRKVVDKNLEGFFFSSTKGEKDE